MVVGRRAPELVFHWLLLLKRAERRARRVPARAHSERDARPARIRRRARHVLKEAEREAAEAGQRRRAHSRSRAAHRAASRQKSTLKPLTMTARRSGAAVAAVGASAEGSITSTSSGGEEASA